MHYWIPGAVAAAMLLSGCSLWPAAEQQKVEQQRLAELKIPQGLQSPRKPGQYDLPAKVVTEQSPEAIDLRAPMQVLAIATNARVEEEEKDARVWFERTEFTGELPSFIKNNIQAYLDAQQISSEQPSPQSWQTGWVGQYQETGWWFWRSQALTQESRFAISMEPRPHGRSVGVKVDLLETRYTDSNQRLSAIAKRREEVNFLNRLIDHVANTELVAIRAAQANRPDLLLSQATNASQQPVFVTTQPIDLTWSQLELLFEKIGLEVSDLNQSEYLYFLKYQKAEQGFWASLWSDGDLPTLPLGSGEYQLKLHKVEQGTELQLLDKDGKALDQATMDQIYQVFASAIREHKLEL